MQPSPQQTPHPHANNKQTPSLSTSLTSAISTPSQVTDISSDEENYSPLTQTMHPSLTNRRSTSSATSSTHPPVAQTTLATGTLYTSDHMACKHSPTLQTTATHTTQYPTFGNTAQSSHFRNQTKTPHSPLHTVPLPSFALPPKLLNA